VILIAGSVVSSCRLNDFSLMMWTDSAVSVDFPVGRNQVHFPPRCCLFLDVSLLVHGRPEVVVAPFSPVRQGPLEMPRYVSPCLHDEPLSVFRSHLGMMIVAVLLGG